MSNIDVLKLLSFGKRVAEEEEDELVRYFIQTDQWSKLYTDEIDIIYGSKGSGKSALYTLLNQNSNELYKSKNIMLKSGENPRGQSVFRQLNTDPPASEDDFKYLWKLYFAALTIEAARERDVNSEEIASVRRELSELGIVSPGSAIYSMWLSVRGYVKKFTNPVEAGIDVGMNNFGQVESVSPRIKFDDNANRSEIIDVDGLWDRINNGLFALRHKVWIALDRLDVAFDANQVLEENAIRALFKVYNDFKAYGSIRLKIFIRTDIWQRITRKGFREATHIIREATISWEQDALLNMLVRRALVNNEFSDLMEVGVNSIEKDLASQYRLFNRIFPRQIDIGPNKPETIKWIIGHTKDGGGKAAPRDLIHLLNESVSREISRLSLGNSEETEHLIARSSVKEALTIVSRDKVQKFLYAEYPDLAPYFDKLKGSKASQTIFTLMQVWNTDASTANEYANEMVRIGFFEKRKDESFRVPFVYRDGLGLSQGSAESISSDSGADMSEQEK